MLNNDLANLQAAWSLYLKYHVENTLYGKMSKQVHMTDSLYIALLRRLLYRPNLFLPFKHLHFSIWSLALLRCKRKADSRSLTFISIISIAAISIFRLFADYQGILNGFLLLSSIIWFFENISKTWNRNEHTPGTQDHREKVGVDRMLCALCTVPLPFALCFFSAHGHRTTPCAQRQPPQVGYVLPKQSSSLASASLHPQQELQKAKSKVWTRSRKKTYSGSCHKSLRFRSRTFPKIYFRENRSRSSK